MTVGSPNDIYEQEADRVSEKVVNMTDAQVQSKEVDTPQIRAKGSSGGMEVPAGFESGLSSIRGKGSPLNAEMRGFYEQRMNAYLGDVRIHTGNKADYLARSINAEAFTAGHDIVFAARNGRNLESRAGKKLLGHELTHVLQQKRTEGRIQRQTAPAPDFNQNNIVQNDRHDALLLRNGRVKRVVRTTTSSGEERYYVLPPDLLPNNVLQDIIVDGGGEIRRTIVHYGRKTDGSPNTNKAIVSRYSYIGRAANGDPLWNFDDYHEWSADRTQSGERFRIRNQTDKYGRAYRDVGYSVGSTIEQDARNRIIVDVGYYMFANRRQAEQPGETVPLLYIERYDYLTNQFVNQIVPNSPNNWTGGFSIQGAANIPRGHANLTWQQIVQENIPPVPNRTRRGFHELMQYNNDGSFITSPRSYRFPGPIGNPNPVTNN
ncbi:MAG: DUF4157 domain-containing protein [bacterium]|nr:DUF4157 domain-containing protein [bacterium]